MGNSAFNREHRLTAEEAQKLLSEKGRQLEGIQHKMRLLYHELEELDDSDDLLKAAAIPARPASGVSGGGRHADNLDVLERYYRQRQERGMEIREQMWRLSEQEEDIRRLWGCFLALQEPYYGILEGLYVDKRLYADVEKSWGYSHSVFEKTRKEGLRLLADMFNSSYTSVELIRMGGLQGTGKKKAGHGKAKQTKGCQGQMELPLGQIQEKDKED